MTLSCRSACRSAIFSIQRTKRYKYKWLNEYTDIAVIQTLEKCYHAGIAFMQVLYSAELNNTDALHLADALIQSSYGYKYLAQGHVTVAWIEPTWPFWFPGSSIIDTIVSAGGTT